jgi:hypothetical protein
MLSTKMQSRSVGRDLVALANEYLELLDGVVEALEQVLLNAPVAPPDHKPSER